MTQTHREAYPEQYSHALCGKTVRVQGKYFEGLRRPVVGKVRRVVQSKYGPLALINGTDTAYRVADCKQVTP